MHSIFDKKTNLFILLSGIFITNALLAEMVGPKIFSLEQTIGLNQAVVKFFGNISLSFNLTAGVILWPVVFITTDIINEYFGKKGVRKVSFLTVGLIAYAFVGIYIITLLEPAPFWLKINNQDNMGRAFDINYAFNTVFSQGLGIIIGSLVAFLIGQFLDAYIFHYLRTITGSKKIWLRATGSTLVSQLVDSFIVLFVAFYLFGKWPLSQVFAVGIINYTYKFLIALLLTPILYVAHYFIDHYLGKELSNNMTKKASKNASFS